MRMLCPTGRGASLGMLCVWLCLLAACGRPSAPDSAPVSAPDSGPYSAHTEITGFTGYACDEGGLARFNRLRFDDTGNVICRGQACDLKTAAGQAIDAGGKTLWPGLIDAHAHLLGQGKARQTLDLTDTRSLDAVQEKLVAWAAARPDEKWIVGRGWNQMQWPVKQFPGAKDIDKVLAERPVVLERVDGHALWVNSAALSAAGIDKKSMAPPGGEILRDENGIATGILVDKAEQLITSLIPEPTRADYAKTYLLAIREANANGLTGVHEAGASYDQLQALKQLAEVGDLTLRIHVMLSDTDENLARQASPQSGLYDDRMNVRSVKIYADGALGSRGAALLAPYSDRPDNSGLLFLDEQSLAARIEKANRLGFQAAVHAIGDRANRVTLDAFESAQKGMPSALRNRIEHAQILDLADIPRFAELGVIASMQPVHATSDMWMAEARLDSARLAGAYAWQSLREAGAKLAFGSDFPVEPVNPFYGLHAAVTREDRMGEPAGGWRAQEKLSLELALCGFTRDAAYAAGDEETVGGLRPGQWADFILLAQDPFSMPASDLWQVQVDETWLAGQRVYHNDSQ